MKSTFINQLPQGMQNEIRSELVNHFYEQGLRYSDLREAVRYGMDGRLSDVEEIIDIKKYK